MGQYPSNSNNEPTNVSDKEVWAARSASYHQGCKCCPPVSPDVASRVVKQKTKACQEHDQEKNMSYIQTGFGRTTEINLPSDDVKPDRFYLVHEPLFLRKIREQKKRIPLLMYFHGKQGTAWDSAIDETNWRALCNEQEFIVVYGQASGAIFEHGVKVPVDDIALSTAFWKSVYPDEDLNYVAKVYEDVTQHVLPDVIDRSRVYYVGFSSGGLFSYNVAVALSCRPFAAICNYMGGVQYDMRDTNSILNAQEAKLKCPIYLLTGSLDSHLEHCRKAKEYLEKANFFVKFEVMEGKKHFYYKEIVEKPMWNFLKQYRLSDEDNTSRSWKDSAEIIQETFSSALASVPSASRPISPPPLVTRAQSPSLVSVSASPPKQ